MKAASDVEGATLGMGFVVILLLVLVSYITQNSTIIKQTTSSSSDLTSTEDLHNTVSYVFALTCNNFVWSGEGLRTRLKRTMMRLAVVASMLKRVL